MKKTKKQQVIDASVMGLVRTKKVLDIFCPKKETKDTRDSKRYALVCFNFIYVACSVTYVEKLKKLAEATNCMYSFQKYMHYKEYSQLDFTYILKL